MDMLPPHEMVFVAELELPDEPWLAEFNDWYSGPHIADVLAAPGIIAAERYSWRRRTGGVRLLALYFHSGVPTLSQTLSSPQWQSLVADFETRWKERAGAPTWQVYRTLGVGEGYRGWPADGSARSDLRPDR